MEVNRKILEVDWMYITRMVSFEAMFNTVVLDTYEGRDVGTLNVPGAYF